MDHCPFLLHGRPLATLVCLFLIATTVVQAQVPTWQAAEAIVQGVNGYSRVEASTADAAGNVYLVGTFSGTVSFGRVALASSSGSGDAFVAKWNSGAGFVWVQRAGGAGFDEATAVAVSGSAVYVAGVFAGSTANFGGTTLANAGLNDAFVAKLVDAGPAASFVWARAVGGTQHDMATAVAVNGPNVYVGGYFASSAVAFDGVSLTNINAGADDAFVAKLADAGASAAFIWAQPVSGTRTDRINALALNGTAVYIAGGFTGAATVAGVPLNSIGAVDVFVAKLIDAGALSSVEWARRGGGASNDDEAVALAVNGANVYVAGYFGSASARFGGLVLPNTDAGAAIPSRDVFVAKLTDAGQNTDFVWAQRAGGTSFDYAFALVVNGPGVYVGGYFSSITADFGNITMVRSGFEDAFIAKLTDAGPSSTFAWVQQIGGPRTSAAEALAMQGGTIYVGGHFSQSATLGPINIASSGTGAYNAFVAILNDAVALSTAVPLPVLLSLSPNPAHNRVTAQWPAIPGATTTTLTLLDALGRGVRTQTVTTGLTADLDLTGLTPGLYALRVTAGTSTATRRLVVE